MSEDLLTEKILRFFNIREAARLIESMAGKTFHERVELSSAQLIKRPYAENPLGGGPQREEILSVSLEAFDCVTYIETALALALSRSLNQFVKNIRELRYENGKVAWLARNHYMTDWLEYNQSRGRIVNLTRGKETVRKTRTLDLVAGLPSKRVSFSCFPKRAFSRVAERIETGDIILFASVKKRLDVFHTGLLIRRGDEILLRHATRKMGAVIEQPLASFLKENRMSGFILLRPVSKRKR
ncbi:MAG: N-acetylmuramoyl-L-alanine amidase-like domain-containing protein [Acidobacteriota bacterium]